MFADRGVGVGDAHVVVWPLLWWVCADLGLLDCVVSWLGSVGASMYPGC